MGVSARTMLLSLQPLIAVYAVKNDFVTAFRRMGVLQPMRYPDAQMSARLTLPCHASHVRDCSYMKKLPSNSSFPIGEQNAGGIKKSLSLLHRRHA